MPFVILVTLLSSRINKSAADGVLLRSLAIFSEVQRIFNEGKKEKQNNKKNAGAEKPKNLRFEFFNLRNLSFKNSGTRNKILFFIQRYSLLIFGNSQSIPLLTPINL